jgi:hypothetical protein
MRERIKDVASGIWRHDLPRIRSINAVDGGAAWSAARQYCMRAL